MKTLINTDSTILIVDDNPENLQILGNSLQRNNYIVEFATDGITALEWLEKTNFDLILLDVMMPGMDGFEVCERLRLNSKYNDIPIIFLTAETEKNSVLKGFKLGAQDYITKPFDKEELIARVSIHLELKMSREKLKSVNQLLEEKVEQRTSELKDTLQQLEEAHHQLIKADKSKAEFLEMISKEIRGPLNHILGIVDSLKAKVDSRDLFDLINLLDQTVSKLEDFSSSAIQLTLLHSNPESIKMKDIPLKQSLEFCILENAELFKEKHIQINHEGVLSDLVINGNDDLLMKLFSMIFRSMVSVLDQDARITFSAEPTDSVLILQVKGQNSDSVKIDGDRLKSDLLFNNPSVDPKTQMTLELLDFIKRIHHGSLEVSQSEDNAVIVKLTFPR